jgi:septum formation protein
VTFAKLDDATIDRYVASGEAMGRAGAYAIQGTAQSFISHLSGSYSGVMGLPLYETARLLREFGLRTGDDKGDAPRASERHA